MVLGIDNQALFSQGHWTIFWQNDLILHATQALAVILGAKADEFNENRMKLWTRSCEEFGSKSL
jgi:hypothetical protein